MAEKEKREAREKMEAYERERAEEKKERVRNLVSKLKDRIRPMVEAKDPGNGEDPEVKRYSDRIRIETQDLAMESFGIGKRPLRFSRSRHEDLPFRLTR